MNNFVEKLKKHNYRGIAQAHKYSVNPFFDAYKIKFDEKYDCYVGKGTIEEVVNMATGEVSRVNVRMVNYKKCDPEKFVKVYVNQLKGVTNLSGTGDKVFIYLLTVLKQDCDRFTLDIADCLKFTRFKEKKSIYKGLVELINGGVIARGEGDYDYFFNTAMAINGDRFAVFNLWEKETGQDVTPRNVEREQRKTLKD